MRTAILFIVIILFCSCQSNEQNAIAICQKAKVHFGEKVTEQALALNATWLEYANLIAQREQSKEYKWKAEKVDGKGMYVVEFADVDGWGQHWEVNTETEIVQSINQSDYLCRKYGFSTLDKTGQFELVDIKTSEFDLGSEYSWSNEKNIIYTIAAGIKNNTGKAITVAELGGNLKVIFKDKSVTSNLHYSSDFVNKPSSSNKWQPGTIKYFTAKTRGLDKVYLDYDPEYVLFEQGLKAEDPIGYSFDKSIAEIDLKKKWKVLKSLGQYK